MNWSYWIVNGFSDSLVVRKLMLIQLFRYLLTNLFLGSESVPTIATAELWVISGRFPFLFVMIGEVFFAFGMA